MNSRITRALTVLTVMACGLWASASNSWATATVTTAYGPYAVIPLVGTSNGVVDPNGEVHVDLNPPLVGATVEIDFGCCSMIELADPQPFQGENNMTTTRISATTNSSGRATFRFVGAAAGATSCSWNCNGQLGASLYANGVFQRNVPVACFDLDGQGGVGANDESIFLRDFGCGAPQPMRSDYDGDGAVGGNDFSIWLQIYGGGLSAQSVVDPVVCHQH